MSSSKFYIVSKSPSVKDETDVAAVATRSAGLQCITEDRFWRLVTQGNSCEALKSKERGESDEISKRGSEDDNGYQNEEEISNTDNTEADVATASTKASIAQNTASKAEEATYQYSEESGENSSRISELSKADDAEVPEAEWRLEVPFRVLECALQTAMKSGTVRFAEERIPGENADAKQLAGWSVVDNAERYPSVWHELRQHYYRPTTDEDTGEPKGHYLYTSHLLDLRAVGCVQELVEVDQSLVGETPSDWLVLSYCVGFTNEARIALAKAAIVEAKARKRRVLVRCMDDTGLELFQRAGFSILHRHAHQQRGELLQTTFWLTAA